MGFMDDLKAVSGVEPCKVGRWLETIDDLYRAEVLQACEEGFPSKTIWRVIVNREGQVFSDSVFLRHRKGECGCEL